MPYLSNSYTSGLNDVLENIRTELDINTPVFNLADFFVNKLCYSVPVVNKWDNILKIATNVRTSDTLCGLQLLYDEDSFTTDAIQDIATPDSKLYYPEPFIASPSFTHEEI